ncbi:homoserine kinase [soil metagenome]
MTREPAMRSTGARCRVSVPASTANLGPGFDGMGCAVALRNLFEFELLKKGAAPKVTLTGACPEGIPTTADNLALQVAADFFRRVGVEPMPLSLRAEINVPGARGLGSSSTAIIAGIAAANALCGNPLNTEQLLDVAVELEGHPDNVAPALLGGMVVSASESAPLVYRRIVVHDDVSFIFIVPDYEVKTCDARAVLPKTVPYADAIYNASRSPLVALALMSGDLRGLEISIDDRLHQTYRKPLFRHYDELHKSAISAGAAGLCVSGAGPTMLAIARHSLKQPVIDALNETLRSVKLTADVREIKPDNIGTEVDVL